MLPLDNMVPELIWLNQASNDKDFLGHLKIEKGVIYVLDKDYVKNKISK